MCVCSMHHDNNHYKPTNLITYNCESKKVFIPFGKLPKRFLQSRYCDLIIQFVLSHKQHSILNKPSIIIIVQNYTNYSNN